MHITGKHLSRRTVLKGMGVTIALPLLDAMVPAGRAWAAGATAPKTRVRDDRDGARLRRQHGTSANRSTCGRRASSAPASI